jgi:HNH endonuclease
MRTNEERFWAKVHKTEHCWEWVAGKSSNGYGAYWHEGAHRVAYRFTYGEIAPRLFVLHHCDNKLCVRPDHLFLGTQADNMHDMCRKKRWRGGAPRHIDPERIKDLLRFGFAHRKIAAWIGVSYAYVGRIGRAVK